jgi:hypothetical protein
MIGKNLSERGHPATVLRFFRGHFPALSLSKGTLALRFLTNHRAQNII